MPGNNFRIAATFIPVNNLDRWQVFDPNAEDFVPAVGDTIKGDSWSP